MIREFAESKIANKRKRTTEKLTTNKKANTIIFTSEKSYNHSEMINPIRFFLLVKKSYSQLHSEFGSIHAFMSHFLHGKRSTYRIKKHIENIFQNMFFNSIVCHVSATNSTYAGDIECWCNDGFYGNGTNCRGRLRLFSAC